MDTLILRVKRKLERLPQVSEVTPAGSYFTCDPPVLDTDIDFAVLVNDFRDMSDFLALGFEDTSLFKSEGADYEDGHEHAMEIKSTTDPKYAKESVGSFRTFRMGKFNLIVMTSARYHLFKASTMIATKLNLLDKEDRVYVFATMRDVLLPTYK